jgi:hypothetical protein
MVYKFYGPSFYVFFALFLTLLMGTFHMSGVLFQFRGANIVIFLPIHAIYVCCVIFVSASSSRAASEGQALRKAAAEGAGQVLPDDDDDDTETDTPLLTPEQLQQEQAENVAFLNKTVWTWSFIWLLNVQLTFIDFDVNQPLLWWVVFAVPMIFTLMLANEGAGLNIWLFTDMRRMTREQMV